MTTKLLASDLVAVVDDNQQNFKRELRICRERAQLGMYFIRVYTTRDDREIVTDLVGEVFTAFTKDASCGRGEYGDEIDVMVSNRPGMATRAKKIATLAIEHHYVKGLRVSKVVRRFGNFC